MDNEEIRLEKAYKDAVAKLRQLPNGSITAAILAVEVARKLKALKAYRKNKDKREK